MDVTDTGPHQLIPGWLVQQVLNFAEVARGLVLRVFGQVAGNVGDLVQVVRAQAAQPQNNPIMFCPGAGRARSSSGRKSATRSWKIALMFVS